MTRVYPSDASGALMVAIGAPMEWMTPRGTVFEIETYPQRPCMLFGIDVPAGARLASVRVGERFWYRDGRWCELGAIMPGMMVIATATADVDLAPGARSLRVVFEALP